MSKKKKVEKVSKETGVEEKDLDRLPVEAIEKLDELVDDTDIFSEEDAAEDSDLASPPEEDPADVVVEEAPANVGRRLVGHDPITKELVYK